MTASEVRYRVSDLDDGSVDMIERGGREWMDHVMSFQPRHSSILTAVTRGIPVRLSYSRSSAPLARQPDLGILPEDPLRVPPRGRERQPVDRQRLREEIIRQVLQGCRSHGKLLGTAGTVSDLYS